MPFTPIKGRLATNNLAHLFTVITIALLLFFTYSAQYNIIVYFFNEHPCGGPHFEKATAQYPVLGSPDHHSNEYDEFNVNRQLGYKSPILFI